MLKWLADMTSARVVAEKSDDGRDEIMDNDDTMMIDLILAVIEAAVAAFETEKEQRKSQECLQKRVPDYSWLISENTQKPKKYLTMSERSRLERACERLRPNEWSKLINLWKARSKSASSREHIFDCFISSVHEVILSRPRPPSVGDVVRKYMRSASSVNAVSDSPRIMGSTRSLADVSFRQLSEIV